MPFKVFPSYGGHTLLQNKIQVWLDTCQVLEVYGLYADEFKLTLDYKQCTNPAAAMPLRIALFNLKHQDDESAFERQGSAWEEAEQPIRIASASNGIYLFILYEKMR